jgi:hypothetical protein
MDEAPTNVTQPNGIEEGEPAAVQVDEPTPEVLLPTLSYGRLKLYLAAKFGGLEKCLLPNVTAALLFAAYEGGEPIAELFHDVPLEVRAQLTALKLLLKSLSTATKTATAAAQQAEKKRLQKLEREEKARAAGVLGKAPAPMVRPWADIVNTAKTNQKEQQDKKAEEDVPGQRAHLEANGAEIMISCPAKDNYQKHHSYLLDHGEDKMAEVLELLGCKFVGFNAENQQITIFFSGPALADFFKKLDKETKKVSEKVVTTQQVCASGQARASRATACVAPSRASRHALSRVRVLARRSSSASTGSRARRRRRRTRTARSPGRMTTPGSSIR